MSYAAEFGERLVKDVAVNGGPMNDSQSRALMFCCLSQDDLSEVVNNLTNPDSPQASFLHMVMKGRIDQYLPQLTVEPAALIWMGSLCKSPGDAVMLSTVFAYLATKQERVTLDDLVSLFPFNVPQESTFGPAWDSQKLSPDQRSGRFRSDNRLDYPESWG